MGLVSRKNKKVLTTVEMQVRKKVSTVPDTIKTKWRNFTELKIKHLRKNFAQKMLQKTRRKFMYKKAKHYHKECRQMYSTEIWTGQIWQGHQEKIATSTCLWNPNWHLQRIKSIRNVSPKVWKVLQPLHLHHIFSGTLLNAAGDWGTICCMKLENELIYNPGYGIADCPNW